MKKTHPWNFIYSSLQDNIPVMLLYVLESSGSSPGRQGFFMGVNADDRMEGSIGGGIMEHKFVEITKERLKAQDNKEQELRKQFHDKDAATNQSGMICSGEQTIWLYSIKEKDAFAVQRIIDSLAQNKNGTLTLSPAGIQFDPAIPGKDFDLIFHSEEDWIYKEKTGYKNKLFIVGGGHCSLAFSRLMQSMDFYISIYDDRKDLKTMLDIDAAHEKHLVNDYAELNKLIPSGLNHYVVIMTFGYRTDDIVLRAVLDKQFRYLGVLGSQAKMDKLFSDYRNDGIPEDVLQRIHTPIGLAIKSQTPEEIAISIAAEIIKVKNQAL